MRVSVYCASSAKVAPVYFDATERLARTLVKANVEVVYGGGAVGLMGRLADTVLAERGKIRGVIPHFMHEVEWTHPKLDEVIFTDTMAQRKAKFLEDIDGLVALPGGTGTLDELLEAITLKRLGRFLKPIVILNTNGYYEPLRQMFEKCVEEHFMNERHTRLWTFVREPEEVLPAIENAPPWDEYSLQFAVVR